MNDSKVYLVHSVLYSHILKVVLSFLLQTLQKERKKAEEYGEVKHRSRKTFKTRLKPSESSQKGKRSVSTTA